MIFPEPYSRGVHTAIALGDTRHLPFADVLIVVIHPPSLREWPSFFVRRAGELRQITRAEAVKSTFDVVALVDAKLKLTLERTLAMSLAVPVDAAPESAELFT